MWLRMRKFNRKVPNCTKGKYHNWRDSDKVFGEIGRCTKCGYDAFDDCYKEVPKDCGVE